MHLYQSFSLIHRCVIISLCYKQGNFCLFVCDQSLMASELVLSDAQYFMSVHVKCLPMTGVTSHPLGIRIGNVA